MAEKGTVAEEATDETLSQAWDTAVEKEVKTEVETKTETETEEKPPEEKPASVETQTTEKEEVLDHKESSHLGRKYKGLEIKVDQILARLDQTKPAEKQERIEVPEVITTPEDVETYLQAREEKSRQGRVQYETNYLKQVSSLKAANEDMHDEIVAEMMQNFNVMYDPNNPFADARVNYSEAKASVLLKKSTGSKPKVPARETSEKTPIQPAASATRTPAKTYAMPKLDKETMDYISDIARREGKSIEDVAKEYDLT